MARAQVNGVNLYFGHVQNYLNIKRYLKIVGIEKHQRDINKPLRNKDDLIDRYQKIQAVNNLGLKDIKNNTNSTRMLN